MRFSLHTLLPLLLHYLAHPVGTAAAEDARPTDMRSMRYILPRKTPPSPLNVILKNSYDSNRSNYQMLDANEEETGISIMAKMFSDPSWTMTTFSSQRATVLTIITSQGSIIVKIPYARIQKSASEVTGALYDEEYEKLIYEPLFGKNGKLYQLLLGWKEKTGWWPDAIRIIISYATRQNPPRDRPAYEEVNDQIDNDLHNLWAFVIDFNAGPKRVLSNSETFPPARQQIMMSDERSENTLSSRDPTPERGYLQESHKKAKHGYAITWDRAAGEYAIWIGHMSVKEPYEGKGDPLVLKTEKDKRGWYPSDVVPVGDEKPGAGCKFTDC